jgi:hypothetical protein
MAAQRSTRLLSDNRQHRLMIHLRVVEAIQRVDGAWARGGQAYTEIAGEFRVAIGHKRGLLLVLHLDEIELVASAIERADEAVDAVTGISKDALYPPGGEPFPEEIAYRLGHAITFVARLSSNRPQSHAASSQHSDRGRRLALSSGVLNLQRRQRTRCFGGCAAIVLAG